MPRVVKVKIEVPRFGFVKSKATGEFDYFSPLPSPFNYGSVLGTLGQDGDPLDALVLGPRQKKGSIVELPVQACVWILDAGDIDDKLICKHSPLKPFDYLSVAVFFEVYQRAKSLLNWQRGALGRTKFEGWAASERRI